MVFSKMINIPLLHKFGLSVFRIKNKGKKNFMKNLIKNKMTNVIALLLMFSIAISIFALPQNVTAQQYTNLQEGGSLPLPSGVTPDYSLETSPCPW